MKITTRVEHLIDTSRPFLDRYDNVLFVNTGDMGYLFKKTHNLMVIHLVTEVLSVSSDYETAEDIDHIRVLGDIGLVIFTPYR